MNDADRHAMAVYLKSLAPTSSRSTPEADMEAMRRGAAIYSDACASCHLDAESVNRDSFRRWVTTRCCSRQIQPGSRT